VHQHYCCCCCSCGIRIMHFRPISPYCTTACSLAVQPCQQPCPAALPAALPGSLDRRGSIARQPCPAALPCSLDRQPCPAKKLQTYRIAFFFRLKTSSLLQVFPAIKRHCDFEPCIQRTEVIFSLVFVCVVGGRGGGLRDHKM
jgi:hypothetical protein